MSIILVKCMVLLICLWSCGGIWFWWREKEYVNAGCWALMLVATIARAFYL